VVAADVGAVQYLGESSVAKEEPYELYATAAVLSEMQETDALTPLRFPGEELLLVSLAREGEDDILWMLCINLFLPLSFRGPSDRLGLDGVSDIVVSRTTDSVEDSAIVA